MKTISFLVRLMVAVGFSTMILQAQQPQGWVTLDGSDLPQIPVYAEGEEPPTPPPTLNFSGIYPASNSVAAVGNEADVATPEIIELARGLEYSPEKIFTWVRDNIAFTHYYGVVKGAAMTLEERSGNDADTCALMVSLLRQCPSVSLAYYTQGKMTLPLSGASGSCNMADYLGVDANTTLISKLIVNGGTPTADIAEVTTGGTTVYQWNRFCVRTVSAVGFTDYDPSFKVHVRVAGMPLTSYSKTALRATAGTATGDVLDATSNVAFETEIKKQTSGLLSYLRINQANQNADVLTGSVKMQAVTTTLSGKPFFPLNWVAGADIHNALPTAMMSEIRLVAGGMDVNFKTVLLSGRTLWMKLGVRCGLYLGDVLIAQESADGVGSQVAFQLGITHPGTFGEQVMSPKNLPRVGVRTISYGFSVGPESLRQHQMQLSRLQAFSSGVATYRLRAEAQNVMATRWLLQTEGTTKILGLLNKFNCVYRHRIGFVADEYDAANNQGGYYIDFPLQYLAANGRQLGADIVALGTTQNFVASALEHAVIAQTQNGDQAASAARLIAGPTAGTRPKLILASVANQSTWKAQTMNCAAADILVIENALSAGGTALLPADGYQMIQQWGGAGYMTFIPSAGGGVSQALITGGYKGGYAGLVKSISSNSVSIMAQSLPRIYNTTAPAQKAVTGGDPVNMNSGQFIQEATDLVIGSGTLPRGITFARRYDGAHRFNNVIGLGQGWSHNLDLTASVTSEAETTLAGGGALESAGMVLSLYAAYDLFKNRTDVKDWALAVMVANWAANQTVNTAVAVRLPDRILQFHQLTDGTWAAPPGCTATLSKENIITGTFENPITVAVFVLQERHGSTWHFGTDGRLLSVEDVTGQRATFNGKNSVTDHQGRTLTMNYNASGQLTSVTDFSGRTVTFGYGGTATAPTLTSVTGDTIDPAFFSYDSSLRMTHVRDAQSRLVVQNTVFDSLDRVSEQVSQNDPARTWRYYYTPTQTIEENPLGQKTRHLFDDKKRSVGTINALGYGGSTEYGKADMPEKQKSPLGFTNSSVYNKDLNPTSSTDALSAVTNFQYDTTKRLKKTSPPVTAGYFDETVVNTYNSWHQPLSVTKADVTTTYTYIQSGLAKGQVDTTRVNGVRRTWNIYNLEGLLKEVWIGADGSGLLQKAFTYTALGDVLTETEGGTTVTYEYNNRRQVKKKTLSPASGGSDLITSYTYTPQGDLETTTNARGQVTTVHYNVLRKPTETILPGGATNSVGYDLADRAVSATNAINQTTTTTLDAAGQATRVTDPLNRTQDTGYDADGRATTSLDALNRLSSTVYTARGEVDSTKQPDNRGISQVYDLAGRRTSLKNRSGNTWTFGYDTYGRPNKVTDPVGWATITTYDSEGRVSSLREPSLEKSVTVYDPLYGRVQKTQFFSRTNYTTPVAEVSHTYFNNGLPKTTTEGTATITRGYTNDPRRLVNSYTNGAGATFGYAHDANGNQTLLTLPDGKTITYGYDNRDRLTTITDWAGRITTLAWDAASRLTSLTRPNGTVRSLFYDGASQMTRIEERTSSGRLIQMVKLGLDAVGRAEKRFTVPLPAAASYSVPNFTYGTNNRINGKFYHLGVLSDDADGNNKKVIKVPAPLGQAALGPTPGIFDIVDKNTNNATWDTRNRLMSLTLADTSTLAFTYDAENLRLTKTRGTSTTSYTHNAHGITGMSEYTIEHLPDGSKRYYIWGGPVGLVYDITVPAGGTTETARYYHGDQVGSTMALTNQAGTVIGRADYTPYGLITLRSGDTNTPFLYNGAFGVMTDSETGLVHMRARYYHPWLARFLSADPSGFGGGMNMYVFADGNPIMLLDALGLCSHGGGSFWSDTKSYWSGFGTGAVAGLSGLASTYANVFTNTSTAASNAYGAATSGHFGAAISSSISDAYHGAGNAYNSWQQSGGYINANSAGQAVGAFSSTSLAMGAMGSAASANGLTRSGAVAGRLVAKPASLIVEDTVSLFHQGTLRGGQVSSTRGLSTSLSSDLGHYRPSGQLYEFQVPRSTYNRWLDEGSALRYNDLHAPTNIITPEIRILPPASGALNQYLVRPPGG